MAIDKERIKDARKTVNNLFGKSLEKKASDAFCLAFGVKPAGDGGLKSFTESVPVAARAAVIEFSRPTDVLEVMQKNVDKVMRSKKWSVFEKALAELPIAGDFLLTSSQALRQSMIQRLRDDFQKISGSIKGTIEGNTSDFQPGPEALTSPTTPSAVTERCWLNRTMRTWVPPHHLTEIMADDNIDLIDLPYRIELEMLKSVVTVAAPDYRKRKKVTGKGVIVAVIDSEIALNHPALRGRVIQKQNYSNELWGNPHFHSTAVAGIVAADDEAGAFAGIAPGATIYNYKVAATNPALNSDDFGGARALQQALEDGADIANCSWGPRPVSNTLSREAQACDTAWALGMSIVKSAGNRGTTDGKLTTPADADGVIVVGATGPDGLTVQSYSSHGPGPGGKLRPHLVAPGGVISPGLSGILTGGTFGTNVPALAGTSFAAPHVAGMLALLLEEKPNMSPDEQRDTLLAACRQLNPHDPNFAGNGLAVLADIQ